METDPVERETERDGWRERLGVCVRERQIERRRKMATAEDRQRFLERKRDREKQISGVWLLH